MKTDSSSIAEPIVDKTAGSIRSRLAQISNIRLLALGAFLLGASITLAHRPWVQPEGGDEAIWDYVAQCIVRGQAPYRDVVEIKSPLSAYLSAAAITFGRSAGLKDVIAVRLLNVLMVGLLSAITFLVAATFLRSLLAASIAFLIPLTPAHFADWMVTGTEPKLPMILFGLVSILLIAKRKPFWSGFFSMLACLCWQPGLMFTGIALLMFTRYLTNWRDLAGLKILMGALVPLIAFLLHFYRIGALGDYWAWTVVYNVSVYAPETAKGIDTTLGLLWRVFVRVLRLDLVLVAIGGAGLILFAIQRVKARFNDGVMLESTDLHKDSIVIFPLIYLAFCFINFQSGPDLIPLFPFIGIFGGWFLTNSVSTMFRYKMAARVPIAAMIALLALIAFRSLTYKVESVLTLHDQEMAFAAISKVLTPDDRVYVNGTVELLVLLNRPNLKPNVDLRQGKDKFIEQRTVGGFRAFIADIESSAPKVVAISRAGRLTYREELMQWVEDHYDQMELPGYDGIYLRRLASTGESLTR